MRRLLVILIALGPLSTICVGQELSVAETKEVKRIVDNYAKVSSECDKFALVGTVERKLLRRKDLSQPATLINDFYILGDSRLKYRRFGARGELMTDEGLGVTEWGTKKTLRGVVTVNENEPEEWKEDYPVRTPVPDFDPWNIAIATSTTIRDSRVKPGLMLEVCDPSKAVSIKQDVRGTLIGFKYKPNIIVYVYFSQKYELLPTVTSWRIKDPTKTPDLTKQTKDGYPWLICEVFTRWGKRDGTWCPISVQVERSDTYLALTPRVHESSTYTLRWLPKRQVDVELLDVYGSLELWNLLDEMLPPDER